MILTKAHLIDRVHASDHRVDIVVLHIVEETAPARECIWLSAITDPATVGTADGQGQ
tara:strand:+ start:36 stop:206 length:171 start_codon:yes stop_codon:yes gene_type:complete